MYPITAGRGRNIDDPLSDVAELMMESPKSIVSDFQLFNLSASARVVLPGAWKIFTTARVCTAKRFSVPSAATSKPSFNIGSFFVPGSFVVSLDHGLDIVRTNTTSLLLHSDE